MSDEIHQGVDAKNGDEIPILDISYASLDNVDIGNKKLEKLGEDLHKVTEILCNKPLQETKLQLYSCLGL